MLKIQPKWRAICDPPKSGSGSSKRSKPGSEEAGEEGVGGSERPEGRKAAKRRMKQKANSTVVDLVTTHLNDMRSGNADMNEMFKEFMITAKQEKAQKIMMRERGGQNNDDRHLHNDS